MLSSVTSYVSLGRRRVSVHIRSVDSRLLFTAVRPGVYWALSYFNVSSLEQFLDPLRCLRVFESNVTLEVKPRSVGTLLLLADGRCCSRELRRGDEVVWFIVKNCKNEMPTPCHLIV